MANVFAVVGERQETVADKETIALLQLFASNPDIGKARTEFNQVATEYSENGAKQLLRKPSKQVPRQP